MKIHTPYTKPETYFFLAILILVGVLCFLVFLPFLATLILAATIAVVVHPVHKKILSLLKEKHTLAAFISVLLLIILIIIPLFVIAAQVFSEAKSAYYYVVQESNTITSTLKGLQDNLNGKIEQFFPGVTIDIKNYITTGSSWILRNVGNFFSGTISVGFHLALGILALYYFIRDGKQFVHFFRKQSPIPEEHVDLLISKLRISIRSIIGGTLVVAMCQSIVAGIGYAIFGIPNPALWGALTGLAGLVPGVGTSLVLLPAVLFTFATGTPFQAIGLGIWALTAVGLLDNFLSPKLIGDSLQIHPLIVLFSIIGGLTFFGPVGFILGPLTVSLFIALFGIYKLMVKTEEAIMVHDEKNI